MPQHSVPPWNEDEHRGDSGTGDEAAEMRPPVDAGGEESDHYVDSEQDDHLLDVVVEAATRHDQCSHETEDGAASADRHRAHVRQCVGGNPSAQCCDEVEHEVAHVPQDPFKGWSEGKEHVHVEGNMQE